MFATGTSLLRTACVGAMLVTALASAAAAQTATTGVVRGTVTSAEGDPVADALVTLVELTSGVRHQTITSREGEFRLVRVPAGEYAAIAEQIGFAPSYVAGVPVRPGVELMLPLRLRQGGPDQLALDSAAFPAGTAALGRAAASRWLRGDLLRSLPYAEPDFAGTARLVSWLDTDFGAEGLPGSFTSLALDGHLFRPVAHPLAGSGGGGGALIPPLAVGAAELIRGAADAEWSSASGVVASALARRGSETFAGQLAGQGSAGPLASAGFFDDGSLSPRALRGSALLEGSMFDDSARFAVGAVIRSDEVARSPAWPDVAGNQDVAQAGGWIGDLGANFQPQLLKQQSIAGFGQLDWRIAEGHRLSVTFAAAQPADQPALAPGSGAPWLVEGTDMLAGATLATDLGGVANQLRLSWASSARESLGTAPTAIGAVVPLGLRLNGSAGARMEESTIRVQDALHFRAGAHAFKLGGDIAVSTHDQAWRPGAVAEVLFGGSAQLQQSTGVFRQTTGPAPLLDWTGRTYGFFLQDSWQGESGVGITLALRAEQHGTSDVPARDAEWFRLTSLANDLASNDAWRLSPRLDLSWLAGERRQFVVNATAGLFHDRIDPLLVGEWLLDDGSARVERFVGNVGVWTVARPAGAVARPRLTVPTEGLRGPETARATAGFAFVVAEGTTITLDAGYRHTRFLPRRADLNLLPAPVARDQYERPVFGNLVQQGGLVAAAVSSNRRFPEYDEVTALSLDGSSTWYGGSARVESSLTDAVSLGAGYTYGRTRDNWFGAAAAGGVGTPAPDLGQNDDWTEADSDFDVPHRGALYATWNAPYGLRASGVFRYESGRPFTPGFPWGVDANGDGIVGNDPAFVDPAVAGVNELVAGWDCLRRASGRFVERNSCRADATATLDARLEFDLSELTGLGLAATLEAIDLLETDFSVPDAALYRIDSEQSLVHNNAERTVTVPLLANPGFGERLARARAGRSLRVGLALTW